MSKRFEEYRDNWLNRRLEDSYYFIYIDAIRINVRRDTVEKESLYIAVGLRKDLKRVYRASTREPAETGLLELEEKWNDKYPIVIKSWKDNWSELSRYFSYSEPIRRRECFGFCVNGIFT